MVPKYLVMKIGFTEKTVEVRMAQYENSARTPKEKMVGDFASELEVSPHALDVPDIDSNIGLIHTLFRLENLHTFQIVETNNGAVYIKLDKSAGRTYAEMNKMLTAWQQQAAKLEVGEITKEEYKAWRYRYHAKVGPGSLARVE